MPRPHKPNKNRHKSSHTNRSRSASTRNASDSRGNGRSKQSFKAHPFEYHQELTVKIESLSNQGDGVAKVDIPEKELENWVIFTPFTIPGETVKIRITRNNKNCSLAELLEVIDASEARRTPACKHFTLCGGCQYQHMDYAMQLEQKTAQIQQLLYHIAGIETDVNATIASPKEYEYRSKITPHFRKPYNGKISTIGFVAKKQGREYLDVDQCPIAMEEINAVLPAIRKQTHHAAKNFKSDHTLLLRAAGGRVETNESTVITETVNDIDFHFLAGDFFQNNPFILPAFVDYAADRAGGHDYLVDAYCGSGLFSLSLAKHFKQVKGVEISVTATDWAKQNARLNKIENTDFIAASAEAIFKDIDFPARETTILIDPPRAGCSQDFLHQLFQYAPRKVVYISCDPATQMRDLKFFMENNYSITDVQPFDLFPQTKHLECIITLETEK